MQELGFEKCCQNCKNAFIKVNELVMINEGKGGFLEACLGKDYVKKLNQDKLICKLNKKEKYADNGCKKYKDRKGLIKSL